MPISFRLVSTSNQKRRLLIPMNLNRAIPLLPTPQDLALNLNLPTTLTPANPNTLTMPILPTTPMNPTLPNYRQLSKHLTLKTRIPPHNKPLHFTYPNHTIKSFGRKVGHRKSDRNLGDGRGGYLDIHVACVPTPWHPPPGRCQSGQHQQEICHARLRRSFHNRCYAPV